MTNRSSSLAREEERQVPSTVFVASHRRSGTHLTLDSLVANFDEFVGGFENYDSQQYDSNARLFKTHVDGDTASETFCKNARVVYVVRDGRDVMVSLFNYAKSHDPEICKMSFSDFLQTENPYSKTKAVQGFNRIQYWNHHVQSWLLQKEIPVKVVTFDQWKASTEETLEELAKFLESSPKSKTKSMVMKSRQRWTKRIFAKIGLTKNTAVQFRGGRSQVWKEYFDRESLDLFANASERTYQLVSDKLGTDFPLKAL